MGELQSECEWEKGLNEAKGGGLFRVEGKGCLEQGVEIIES